MKEMRSQIRKLDEKDDLCELSNQGNEFRRELMVEMSLLEFKKETLNQQKARKK